VPLRGARKQIVDEVDRVIAASTRFSPSRAPKGVSEESIWTPFSTDPAPRPDGRLGRERRGVVPAVRVPHPADGELLRRALLNLIINALRASASRADRAGRGERAGCTLALSVSDSGCGISPADLPRVTEPYFSRFAGGSGLGLPIVEQIATAHGWRLRLVSALGEGTRVTLEGIAFSEGAG
jgi:signal transduction histidine kinase